MTIEQLQYFMAIVKYKNFSTAAEECYISQSSLSKQIKALEQELGGVELFDRNTVRYIEVPFDEEAYAIYLEGVIECEISTNKYPKNFQQILKKLTSMVYPLLPNANINRPEKKKKGYQYSTGFSSSVNNTLNDMKRKY